MATARKSTARKRTSSKRKSAKRSRGAIAAAHLGGIGDIETFTAIREIYDRFARRLRRRAGRGNRNDRRGLGLALDGGRPRGTRSARLSGSATQSARHRISQHDHAPSQQRRDELVLGLRQLVFVESRASRHQQRRRAVLARLWAGAQNSASRLHRDPVARVAELVERPCRFLRGLRCWQSRPPARRQSRRGRRLGRGLRGEFPAGAHPRLSLAG